MEFDITTLKPGQVVELETFYKSDPQFAYVDKVRMRVVDEGGPNTVVSVRLITQKKWGIKGTHQARWRVLETKYPGSGRTILRIVR